MPAARFPYPSHPVTPYPPLVVNVALTGMVGSRERVPHLPLTAEEIVSDAERCYEAGAVVAHLHARDGSGRPEWRRGAYAEMIPEIRRRCPGIVICATTSGREEPDVDRRGDVLRLEGEARPDMASLTLGSLNFATGPSVSSIEAVEELARRMRDAGIRPELEVFDVGMAHLAHRLLDRGLVREPLFANLMLGFPNSAPANARSVVALLDALPATSWAAAGMGAFQQPANMLACAIGGHVRTGLEDNPYLNHLSREPATNPALVRRAADLAAAADRPLATPNEARALLGLGTGAPEQVSMAAGG